MRKTPVVGTRPTTNPSVPSHPPVTRSSGPATDDDAPVGPTGCRATRAVRTAAGGDHRRAGPARTVAAVPGCLGTGAPRTLHPWRPVPDW